MLEKSECGCQKKKNRQLNITLVHSSKFPCRNKVRVASMLSIRLRALLKLSLKKKII
jgi:hypothetical protein